MGVNIENKEIYVYFLKNLYIILNMSNFCLVLLLLLEKFKLVIIIFIVKCKDIIYIKGIGC